MLWWRWDGYRETIRYKKCTARRHTNWFYFISLSTTGKAVCEYPGEPKNGYIVPTRFHYSIGEGISVICKSPKSHLGPTFIYCTPQGVWSSPLPVCASDDDELDEEDEEANNIDDTVNKNTIEARDSLSPLMSSDEPVERKHSSAQSHSSRVKQLPTYQMSRQVPYNKAYQQYEQGQFNRYSNDNNDNKYSLHTARHGDHL